MFEIIASCKLYLIRSDSLKNVLFGWTAVVKEKEEAWGTLDQMNQKLFFLILQKMQRSKILIVMVSCNGKKSQDSKATTLRCSFKWNMRTYGTSLRYGADRLIVTSVNLILLSYL